MTQFPRFAETLRSLGQTQRARGRALDVSPKTIERYAAGDIPDFLVKLTRHPSLLRALAEDAATIDSDSELVHIRA